MISVVCGLSVFHIRSAELQGFPAVTGRFLVYFFNLTIYTSTVPGLGLELN